MPNPLRTSHNPAPEFVLQLRAARLEAGLSQRALAEGTGWDKTRVRDYEEGVRAILPRLLEQWAQAVCRTITTLPTERHCRVCHCTEDNPCDGGCSWVAEQDNTLEADLCTTCAWAIARDAIASGLYTPDQAKPGPASGFATGNEALSGPTTDTDKAAS